MTYCGIGWGGASNTALHRLSVLQNRAIRLITRSPFRTSTTPLFEQLKLLKITDIRRLQILLFMYKCKNKQVPVNCLNLCPLNLNHPYNMRSTNHFIVFPFRTSIREQCISTMGPRSWNSLSSDLQNIAVFSHLSVKFQSILFRFMF